VVWPDGQVRMRDSRVKIRRDAEGKVIEVVGTVQDVTERKQAEEATQLAQARLVSALEGGRMGTWVWDIAGNASLGSAGGFRMFLQIGLDERTHGNNLELIEVGEVQRSADQLLTQAAAPRCFRHFRVQQTDVVVHAVVLQDGFFVTQRNLKLPFGFIVCNGVVVHETRSFYLLQQILREHRAGTTNCCNRQLNPLLATASSSR
jgi:hypothetical protein